MDVTVYGPLRAATGGKRLALSPEHQTVQGVLDALLAEYPRAESQLLDDEASLRVNLRITVDGESATLEDACPPDAEVATFPAMRGG